MRNCRHNQRVPRFVHLVVALVVLATGTAAASAAEPAETVLVVANGRHPWSVRIAERYLAARRLPASSLLVVEAPTDAAVTREVYQQAIEGPVAEWLRDHEAFDRIRFVVLGPGLPLRIAGTIGRNGSTASVDSELTLLYRRLTGAAVAASGFIANPYFSPGPLTAPRPFDRSRYDIYLVTRLDGRTEDDAAALIGRAGVRPERFVFVADGRPREASGAESRWLDETRPRVIEALPGATVVADATADVVGDTQDVTGYASWGSNDARARIPPVRFGPGALAVSFMSSDARTMAAPPAGWVPGLWSDASRFFAGSPEALAADWLAAGLTGLGAQANEPYLDGAFRPATLFEAWVRGYTLGESFYLAMPYLSWQAVVFGDPLARAVAAPPDLVGPLTADVSGVDLLIDRRAAVYRSREPELDLEASRLMARANLSIGRGELAEARQLLEQVTVRAPRYVAAQLLLGQQYDAAAEYALARARYELVLTLQPANAVALNNLAYNIGVRGEQPAQALEYAERAAAVSGNSPAVLDTLGWIRHLSGNHRGALDPLRRAVQGDSSLCEAWEHLAVVERAVGNEAAGGKAGERATACHAAAPPVPQ